MADGTTRLFFSYSRSDAAFVLDLATRLRQAGRSVWVDQLDIPKGARWDVEVERALKASTCLLAVLTPASAASQNVMDEVSYALGESKTVIPLLVQPCDVPFRLKRLQHIDFTGDADEAFRQLGVALDAQGAAGGAAPLAPVAAAARPAAADRAAPRRTSRLVPAGIAAAVIAAAVAGYLGWAGQTNSTSAPPTERLLRQAIESAVEGKCADVLGPVLKSGCEQQASQRALRAAQLGPLKSLTFRGKEQSDLGTVDTFLGEHANGQVVWLAAATPEGKLRVFRSRGVDAAPAQ